MKIVMARRKDMILWEEVSAQAIGGTNMIVQNVQRLQALLNTSLEEQIRPILTVVNNLDSIIEQVASAGEMMHEVLHSNSSPASADVIVHYGNS